MGIDTLRSGELPVSEPDFIAESITRSFAYARANGLVYGLAFPFPNACTFCNTVANGNSIPHFHPTPDSKPQ